MNNGKNNNRGLLVLVVSVFFDIFGVALVIPMLPVWAKALGATPTSQGLIGTVYGACQLVGAVVAGRISDQHGRKVVLLASIAMAGISYPMGAMATSLPAFFFWRVPVGLCKQTMSVASAYISDSATEENRSVWLAATGSSAALGFVVGPALGGWLGAHDAALPAFVSAALFAANFVAVWLLLPESAAPQQPQTQQQQTKSEQSFLQSIVTALQTPLVGELLFVHALFHMAFQLVKSSLFFSNERFGFGAQENGLLLAYVGVLTLFGKAGFVPVLAKYFSDTSLLFGNLLLMTGALLALAFASNMWLYCAALIPFTASTSVVGTVVVALVSGAGRSSGNVGALLGVASAFESITRILSPAICGVLIQSWAGVGAPPFVGALVAGVAAAYVGSKWQQLVVPAAAATKSTKSD